MISKRKKRKKKKRKKEKRRKEKKRKRKRKEEKSIRIFLFYKDHDNYSINHFYTHLFSYSLSRLISSYWSIMYTKLHFENTLARS